MAPGAGKTSLKLTAQHTNLTAPSPFATACCETCTGTGIQAVIPRAKFSIKCGHRTTSLIVCGSQYTEYPCSRKLVTVHSTRVSMQPQIGHGSQYTAYPCSHRLVTIHSTRRIHAATDWSRFTVHGVSMQPSGKAFFFFSSFLAHF